MLTALIHFSDSTDVEARFHSSQRNLSHTGEFASRVEVETLHICPVLDFSRILGRSKYLEQCFENAAGRVYRYYPGPGRHIGEGMLPGEGMASGLGWYGGIEFLKKWLTGPVFQVGWHQKGGGLASVAPSGGTKPSSQVGFYRAGGFQVRLGPAHLRT